MMGFLVDGIMQHDPQELVLPPRLLHRRSKSKDFIGDVYTRVTPTMFREYRLGEVAQENGGSVESSVERCFSPHASSSR